MHGVQIQRTVTARPENLSRGGVGPGVLRVTAVTCCQLAEAGPSVAREWCDDLFIRRRRVVAQFPTSSINFTSVQQRLTIRVARFAAFPCIGCIEVPSLRCQAEPCPGSGMITLCLSGGLMIRPSATEGKQKAQLPQR